MASADTSTELDALLATEHVHNSPWIGGQYVPRDDLLRELLSIPIKAGATQQSGRIAKALDAWIANELRRAGFPENAVWPRRRQPRVMPEELAEVEAAIAGLANELDEHEAKSGKLTPPKLRSAIRKVVASVPNSNEARVLGEFYAKQIDVAISSWRRGPEVLVSTKTMFSSFRKNLKNRHEEAVGEVTSLRARHPMATMGYAYLVHSSIHDVDGAFGIAVDILSRLREYAGFDAALLLVGEWDLENPAESSIEIDEPIPDLGTERFFTDLVTNVLNRSPVSEHVEVRSRRDPLAAKTLPDEGSMDIEPADEVEDDV